MVRRVRLEPSVLMSHQIGLNSKNAVYPVRMKEIIPFALGKGATTFYKEQVFGDRRLPNFILITFQNAGQYNGFYKDSASKFDHVNVKSLTLMKNSDYRETYTQDFENNDYATTYMQSIVRNMGYLDKNLN